MFVSKRSKRRSVLPFLTYVRRFRSMLNKIAVLLVYYGNLPGYFQLWLNSVGKNLDINFLFVTDCDLSSYKLPCNLIIHRFCFNDLQQLVKEKVDGVLSTPYKLCDYKIAYGDIFADLLKEYSWFGWCDCDLIFGNIQSFITDEMLDNYDKIGITGFFVLMRNIKEIREYYKRTDIKTAWVLFNEVKRHSCNFAFDEKSFMNRLFAEHYRLHTLRPDMIGDTRPQTINFNTFNNQKIGKELFHYKNGLIHRIGENFSKEMMLVHLLKRTMPVIGEIDYNDYWITPKGFCSTENNEVFFESFTLTIEDQELYKKIYKKKLIITKIKRYSNICYDYYLVRKLIRRYSSVYKSEFEKNIYFN